MWTKVADGPYQNVEYSDIATLPHGTPVKFELETKPGLAYLADIWGDEWVLNKFAADGVVLETTESVDSSHILCTGHVESPGIGIIVGIILAVVAIAGIGYLISRIKMWVDAGVLPGLPEFTPETITLIAAVGIAALFGVMALKSVVEW